MASAILANNNEPHWGPKVYHRNSTVNSIQFAAPISNPNPKSNAKSRKVENPNPSPPRNRQTPPVADDVVTRNDYVTINLSEYSRVELRELERRLLAELDQVRQVRAQIDTVNVVSRPESPPVILSPKPSKKVLGQKRAPSSGPNRESKRLATPISPSPELEGILKKMMMRCSQMLGKLMKHRHAWIFNKPVDTVGLGLHDYFDIIDQPMDLGTIKTKLRMKEYKNPIEFASDVRLTFKNAMRYNPKGQDAHIMAETLLGIFEKMFNPAINKFEDEKGHVLAALGMKIPNITNEPEHLVVDNVQRSLPKPGPIQRLTPEIPKPNTKGMNKRVMSFEEKEKLGACLQELPSDKMDAMLEIVSRGNNRMDQEGDEIELDIDTLDNETLWELDRFVNNIKKDENKMKMQAPAPAEKLKDPTLDIGDEDVDIGDDIPLSNYPPVEIEMDTNCGSSSGNSSSSNDSSSSSGSGSVSSSGSDSEEDSVQSNQNEAK